MKTNVKVTNHPKILIVNAGSSSLKFKVMSAQTMEVLASGNCERIGQNDLNDPNPKSFMKYENQIRAHKDKKHLPLENHDIALKFVLSQLMDTKTGVIKDLKEIVAVGHRVVNAGNFFTKTTIMEENEIEKFSTFSLPYAPLHNNAALRCIVSCKKKLPKTPQVIVLDTSFHQTMPEKVYRYAVPNEWYQKYGVRSYGAHGMSHRYVTEKAAEVMGKDVSTINMISCHLGNGASITAIKNGKSYDTSMGFTPLQGLIMGTRSGDIDPAVLEFVMEREKIDIRGMTQILNKKSGLLAISQKSGDMREIMSGADSGDALCKLALEMFVYRVVKYIGAYVAALGTIDCITFEGGIGENSARIVAKILEHFKFIGIEVDSQKLEMKYEEGLISEPSSKVPVYMFKTDEEKIICQEVKKILNI